MSKAAAPPLGRVLALQGASHFHQPAGRHPRSQILASGHERVELVTGGRGAVWHHGDWVPVGAGDLLWQCVGDATIGRSDFGDPYRCLALHFAVTPDGVRPVRRLTRWGDLEAVDRFSRDILGAWVDQRYDRALLTQHAYSQLLFRAWRWLHREPDPSFPAPLQQALDLIERDYATELTVPVLARAVGWSPTRLHAAFRHQLGVTPHQHLLARRLRAARALLTGSDHAIAEIARRSGFANAAHFSRAFKQDSGDSPRDYRRRHGDPGRW